MADPEFDPAPEEPLVFLVDGPEFATEFGNKDGVRFKLSVNVVLDQWPPDILQLHLAGGGMDETATYVLKGRGDG